MCGILAHLSIDPQFGINQPQLKNLNDALVHRGPDDEGFFIKGNVALGMRRLSIVDVAGGHQPMTSRDGRYTIVFNGEIYNHQDLGGQLRFQGVALATHSDTEVLLYAYATWGAQCLEKLQGMFAFVIWDEVREELFAARDRMGMKPLYYTSDDKRLMFASELTPIVRSGFFDLRLNHKAISEYLSFWYMCEPQTIFEHVTQLPPGHYAVVQGGRLRIERYWQIPRQETKMSLASSIETLEALLTQSVREHLNADVPLGTFLSGGIDSGVVTAMAAAKMPTPVQAFAIGFKDASYDETALARLTAQRHNVHLDVHIMEDITPDLVEKIIGAFDEPLGNASYVPTYLLARAARQKLKVVLTGDGGDELFGGYPTYQAPYYQQLWSTVPAPLKSMTRRFVAGLPVSHKRISLDYQLKQLMQGVDLDYRRAHCVWREIASLSAQKGLWQGGLWEDLGGHDPFSVAASHFEQAQSLSRINQLMYVDLNTYLLNDHLRKVDRMTMAHGLEARLPFMDHRIVEFAMRLPAEHKVAMFATKKILKNVAAKYLPKAVLTGKKKGLTSPIAGWIQDELKDYVGDVLHKGLVGQLFNPDVIEGLCQEHWSKRKDHSRLLWGLLTLQVWHKQLKGTMHESTHQRLA